MHTTGMYILNGKTPVEETDLLKWNEWMERPERIVKQTKLPDNVRVSTVFLGLDYSWHGGTPILFETMIFGGEHHQYHERYSTWDEAEEGHQRAIELVFT